MRQQWLTALASFALVLGCEAELRDGWYGCDDGPCPAGFVCVEDLCQRAPTGFDAASGDAGALEDGGAEAGPGLDSGPDASSNDAGLDATLGFDAAGDAAGDVIDPSLLPARPLAPLSTSTVTSQRPTLRWALAAETTGAQVELCRDREMTTGCLAPIPAEGVEMRPVSALDEGWWFWRLRGRADVRLGTETSPVWQFRVGHRSASGDVDTSWGTVLDVNGDGFADVVVGAPSASPGGRQYAGTVSIFLGSALGPSGTPELVLEGAEVGDFFGESVASAGDVNGDGFADLLIGAGGANPGGLPQAGTVSVFLGSTTGLSATPALVLEGGAAGDFFGASVATAGDSNGDGFADIVVGAPLADPGGRSAAGTVSVFLGSPTGLLATPTLVLEGAAAGDEFGRPVASAGDVNGDGYADVVVGASLADSEAGTVSVFMGSVSGLVGTPALVLEGTDDSGQFGASLASAGDVNGDGLGDVVVGAPAASPDGRGFAGTASVFLGTGAGLAATPALMLEGAEPGDFFGQVAGAGDVNGDGFADVLVGAPGADPGGQVQAGIAHVYVGSTGGLSATPASVLEGAAASDFFGQWVVSAGDMNGDNFVDVVVAAPSSSPGARERAGTASVFLGSASGVATVPVRVFEGAEADDFFGHSVAGGT